LAEEGTLPYLLQVNDAYTVLLREKKLPMSLLEDPEKNRSEGAKVTAARQLISLSARLPLGS
jgi:hypothetical protein